MSEQVSAAGAFIDVAAICKLIDNDVRYESLTPETYAKHVSRKIKSEPASKWISQVCRIPFMLDGSVGDHKAYTELASAYRYGARLALTGVNLAVKPAQIGKLLSPGAIRSNMKQSGAITGRRVQHIWTPQMQAFGRRSYAAVQPQTSGSFTLDTVDRWYSALSLSDNAESYFKTGFTSFLHIAQEIVHSEANHLFDEEVLKPRFTAEEEERWGRLSELFAAGHARD